MISFLLLLLYVIFKYTLYIFYSKLSWWHLDRDGLITLTLEWSVCKYILFPQSRESEKSLDLCRESSQQIVSHGSEFDKWSSKTQPTVWWWTNQHLDFFMSHLISFQCAVWETVYLEGSIIVWVYEAMVRKNGGRNYMLPGCFLLKFEEWRRSRRFLLQHI